MHSDIGVPCLRSIRSVGRPHEVQSCQSTDPGVWDNFPFWTPLRQRKNRKESALHHIFVTCVPLCSQHKEICENGVNSGSERHGNQGNLTCSGCRETHPAAFRIWPKLDYVATCFLRKNNPVKIVVLRLSLLSPEASKLSDYTSRG